MATGGKIYPDIQPPAYSHYQQPAYATPSPAQQPATQGVLPLPQPSYAQQQQPVVVVQQHHPSNPATYVIVPAQNDSSSLGIMFFVLGWCCTPLWWIGSCVPSNLPPSAKNARFWKQLNLVMTIISVIVIISLIVIAISAPYIYQKLD